MLSLEFQKIEVTNWIESILDTVSARLDLESNIGLHYDIGKNVPKSAITDGSRLGQVIHNLVSERYCRRRLCDTLGW
jgi:hypothetical protein